jgi:hypothetical protein
MPSCPECGQHVSRRALRAEDLAFEILNVRDQLAQFAPRHEGLAEVCAQGEDFARHLHLAAHDSASAAPMWTDRAKGWLGKAMDQLDDLIDSNEVPATWSPLPQRATTTEGTNERVLISA